MKGIRLGLMLACNSCLLMAQSIQSDATFGINGRVETDLIDQNLNPYGYNLALLPDEAVSYTHLDVYKRQDVHAGPFSHGL